MAVFRFSLAGGCGVVVTLALVGCQPAPAPVVQYEIPTAVPAVLQSEGDRMLAAMVPVGANVWFYKVMGPAGAVGQLADRFESFVQSVEYAEGEPDLSALPEGWRRGGKKPFRFATIDVPAEVVAGGDEVNGDEGNSLDISVSKLSRQEDYDSMVAMNVNRWRGQLGLPPSSEALAGAKEIQIEAADGPAMWVDLVGQSGGGQPPMMAGGGPLRQLTDGDQMRPAAAKRAIKEVAQEEGASQEVAASGKTTKAEPVTFDTPEGWRPGRTSSMRLAAFKVGPEDSAAEITVIPAGGDLRSNVARWIGQIRGDTPPEEVVDGAMAAGESLSVDGRPGQRFYLAGQFGEESGEDSGEKSSGGTVIDAAVIDLGDGYSLFVKMTGPDATVSAERDRIGAFLDSMKINL